MQRIDNAEYFHARNACYLCLGPHDVVDTEVQIEGEGVLAICRTCIADLARTAGFDLTDRRAEIEELQAALAESNHARVEAEAVILDQAKAAEQIRAKREQLAAARAVKAEKFLVTS